MSRMWASALAIDCGLMFFLAGIALGQAAPAFEVISIKANVFVPPPHGQQNCSGGRFVSTDSPMKAAVEWAYDVNFFQISEVPDWFDSFQHTYNIEAKAAVAVSQAECKRMVQALFEDRFKLKVHREPRPVPVWALTVVKGGPKLQEVTADTPSKPGGGVRIHGRAPTMPPGVDPPKGWTMQQLVNNFTGMPALSGRPVVDRTGLKGTYEIDLDYAITPADESRPDLRDAVLKLGLKLEETKEPMDFLVIDHVERPSEN